jgi:plastocyanin
MNQLKKWAFVSVLWGLGLQAWANNVSVTVVDREGRPAPDAVVVLVPANRASAKLPASTPPMAATINQEKMQFVPAVTVVAVGAKVRYLNNDPWDHHIRGTPHGAIAAASGGKELFEIRLEGKDEGKAAKGAEVVMIKPGPQSAVLLGCFLHGSMRGHVYVADSPWTRKTGANGVAQFEDVPSGLLEIKVWHADQLVDLPVQTTNVSTVPLAVQVQLQVVPRRRRV